MWVLIIDDKGRKGGHLVEDFRYNQVWGGSGDNTCAAWGRLPLVLLHLHLIDYGKHLF